MGLDGANVIFVNEGINGELLGASQKEIIDYINTIYADMYLRIEIYDGELKYHYDYNGEKQRAGECLVGYYDDGDYEMAKAFTPITNLNEVGENEFDQNIYLIEQYIDFAGYQKYLKDYRKYFYEESLVKLNNDYIVNECEVPTLVQFIAVCDNTEVNFLGQFYNGDNNGLITVYNALRTDKAISMIETNINKNNRIRTMAEMKIDDMVVSEDSKEYTEITKPVAVKVEETKTKVVEKNKNADINYAPIIVLSSMVIGIVICLVIIIIDVKRKKSEIHRNGW